MKIKSLVLIIVIIFCYISCVGTRNTGLEVQNPVAEISFDFTRLSGFSTNQFAVWIEDTHGQYVKTLYVTKFTANGGWQRRPSSIPTWVNRSGISELSKAQIDTISGATPRSQKLVYMWDGKDSKGAAVPPADYVIYLEGTLRGENQVLYSAPIRLGGGPSTPVVSVVYTGDAGNDREMIRDVRVTVR